MNVEKTLNLLLKYVSTNIKCKSWAFLLSSITESKKYQIHSKKWDQRLLTVSFQ